MVPPPEPAAGREAGESLRRREFSDGVVECWPLTRAPLNLYQEVPGPDAIAELRDALCEMARIEGIDDGVMLVHLPSWGPVALALREALGWPIVYDCLDDWSEFEGLAAAVAATERELVAAADAVTTTAARLLARWSPIAAESRLIRNGVDPGHYDSPPEERPLEDCARPVIGFMGGIADWVDLDLVAHVAGERPDWTFVLVGEAFVDVAPLEGLANVRLEGAQPYELMPAYVRDFDVCLIPFVQSALTASVDPVKLYEYFAAGKPVVVTPLPELDVQRGLVHEAADPDGFVAAIEAALAEDDPELPRRRRAVAADSSWEDRAGALRGVLEDVRSGSYRAVRRRSVRRALAGCDEVVVVGEPARVAGIVALDPARLRPADAEAGADGLADVLAGGLDGESLAEAAATAAQLGRERVWALHETAPEMRAAATGDLARQASDAAREQGFTVLETRRLLWAEGNGARHPGTASAKARVDRDTRELLLTLAPPAGRADAPGRSEPDEREVLPHA
jgi:glycosyltransferase involved in cell wall biosynthesis